MICGERMNSADEKAMVKQAEDVGNRLIFSLKWIRDNADNIIKDLENGKFKGHDVFNKIGFVSLQAINEEAEVNTLLKHLNGYKLQFCKEYDGDIGVQAINNE